MKKVTAIERREGKFTQKCSRENLPLLFNVEQNFPFPPKIIQKERQKQEISKGNIDYCRSLYSFIFSNKLSSHQNVFLFGKPNIILLSQSFFGRSNV